MVDFRILHYVMFLPPPPFSVPDFSYLIPLLCFVPSECQSLAYLHMLPTGNCFQVGSQGGPHGRQPCDICYFAKG